MNTVRCENENRELLYKELDVVSGGFHAFGYTIDVTINGTSATAVYEGTKAALKLVLRL